MPAVELGVTRIGLTSEGKTMFPFAAKEGCLRVYEYHRMEIVVLAKWFKELSEENQVFFNNENTILTFQGNPEMSGNITMIELGNVSPCMGVKESEKKGRMERRYDGLSIWERILRGLCRGPMSRFMSL